MSATRPVPCNGCTACCYDELIILHPEDGDNQREYLTKPVMHPATNKPVLALQQKPDGACIYLGENGCSIHGRAPAICRSFDCRRMFEHLGSARIRKMVEAGTLSPAVVTAARARRFL